VPFRHLNDNGNGDFRSFSLVRELILPVSLLLPLPLLSLELVLLIVTNTKTTSMYSLTDDDDLDRAHHGDNIHVLVVHDDYYVDCDNEDDDINRKF